jgi:hypothetical protein
VKLLLLLLLLYSGCVGRGVAVGVSDRPKSQLTDRPLLVLVLNRCGSENVRGNLEKEGYLVTKCFN